MFYDKRLWCVLCALWCACDAGGWSWPEGAQSVRIDTKVRFLDDGGHRQTDKNKPQSDDVPFREATDTEGFYNRPPGSGRYPVKVETDSAAYQADSRGVYSTRNGNDGTVDSLQFCKCVNTPDCNPRPESAEACGAGRFLCCYKRPNKLHQQNTEFFNEIDDERPMLFPGKENIGGPFPPPPGTDFNGVFGPGHGHETIVVGAVGQRGSHNDHYNDARRPVIVGPGGPTGHIGPASIESKPVLVGPDGPTGVTGPAPVGDHKIDATAQRGVLVGPGGPTGIIGPYNQRPVLVGPRGPTGIIGPNRGGSRGVLVGPGGPTGIVGPGFTRQQGPGVLVGPGGPTGIIGPGRQLLSGPGGPTGLIGPQRFFDFETKNTEAKNMVKQVNAMSKQKKYERGTACSRSPGATSTSPSRTTVRRVSRSPRSKTENSPSSEKTHRVPHRRVRRACSRGDYSCGGSPKKQAQNKPQGITRRDGKRRRGGSPNTQLLNDRARAKDTKPLNVHTLQTTSEPPLYTTVKPSLFRFIPFYMLLLKAVHALLALGVV